MVNKSRSKKYSKSLLLILILIIGISVFLYSFKTARSEVKIGGDIYSGGNLGNNITVENNSVASANGTVEVGGTAYKIGGIQLKSLTDMINPARAGEIITKLRTLSPRHLGNFIDHGLFRLNLNNFPEGTIWYKKGDFQVFSNVRFQGKGTIIVEDGNLYINGNVTYEDENSSVGFIVKGTGDKGNIIIKPEVNKLRGAYFATGKITFEK